MINTSRRLLIGATGALALGSIAAVSLAQAQPRVIDIIAKKFEFIPHTIEVKKGETVLLRFTAPEVAMGANFFDFKARVDIVPEKVATLLLTPDKVGAFTFLCDVFCGKGHEDMEGTLIVS